ncbi:hypothetical protein A7D27_11740 [Pseudomonas sp. 1D4]|uniref:hypothetical protein n=1 Tax=Pseudomonadaceae TaxID=135621 RepID=UPI00084B31DE|nr:MULTISPECIES: hypothetical protein [Pseudomonas]OEC42544.1 hypothetical protein A7D27_11740 [Pseudomonas sp. 1D4]
MRRPLSAHPALSGLDQEQLAELALVGLRYRALGAQPFDLRDSKALNPYWTAEKLVADAVSVARMAVGTPLANLQGDRADGCLAALYNVQLISREIFKSRSQELWLMCRGARP